MHTLGYVDHPLVRECQSYPSTSASPTHAVARDLTVILYPVGRDKKYSLYVSWQTSSLDGKLNAMVSVIIPHVRCFFSANTQGFYIWSYKCSGACPFHNDTAPPYNNLPFYDRGRYECLPVHNAVSLDLCVPSCIIIQNTACEECSLQWSRAQDRSATV